MRDIKQGDLKEFLIIVCKKTTPEAMATINQIKSDLGDLTVTHQQQLPFLGGAMREAFKLARGSHVIMMASDLETDPKEVGTMIAASKKNPSAIITASRWQDGIQFLGYSKIKLACNWVFQKLFALLYATKLSDLTFAYRLFPTPLVKIIQWEDLRHSFLFETLVKPLRLGVPVIEIPSAWRARVEGESQNTFFRNFEYFRIGWRTRFAPLEKILTPDALAASLPVKTSNAD